MIRLIRCLEQITHHPNKDIKNKKSCVAKRHTAFFLPGKFIFSTPEIQDIAHCQYQYSL